MSNERKLMVRIKPAVNWTLDADVIAKVEELSTALSLKPSQFANIQLRIALGLMDSTAMDFLTKGGGKDMNEMRTESGG